MNEPKPKIAREDLQREHCRAEFWKYLEEAMRASGIRCVPNDVRTMTVGDFAQRFAHNGLRVGHALAYHMDAVHVTDAMVDAVNALR